MDTAEGVTDQDLAVGEQAAQHRRHEFPAREHIVKVRHTRVPQLRLSRRRR